MYPFLLYSSPSSSPAHPPLLFFPILLPPKNPSGFYVTFILLSPVFSFPLHPLSWSPFYGFKPWF